MYSVLSQWCAYAWLFFLQSAGSHPHSRTKALVFKTLVHANADHPAVPLHTVSKCLLLELTRQITPPTKNDHAPPPIKC
jgi:hypothetical protein